MKNVAIILASGNGERFGAKKQFINFMGKPLYRHVYEKALQVFDKNNIIVTGVDIPGGAVRSKSVIEGLKYFSPYRNFIDKVIILEAARPLVTISQINKLIKCPFKSATYAMPLVNTVILRDGTYVNRDDYYDLLSPQAFDYNMLLDAYLRNTEVNLTDETRLMYETYNIKPSFIIDGKNLVKLTYAKDLPILEHLYKLQEEGVL